MLQPVMTVAGHAARSTIRYCAPGFQVLVGSAATYVAGLAIGTAGYYSLQGVRSLGRKVMAHPRSLHARPARHAAATGGETRQGAETDHCAGTGDLTLSNAPALQRAGAFSLFRSRGMESRPRSAKGTITHGSQRYFARVAAGPRRSRPRDLRDALEALLAWEHAGGFMPERRDVARPDRVARVRLWLRQLVETALVVESEIMRLLPLLERAGLLRLGHSMAIRLARFVSRKPPDHP